MPCLLYIAMDFLNSVRWEIVIWDSRWGSISGSNPESNYTELSILLT
jgi:hypothetical protein